MERELPENNSNPIRHGGGGGGGGGVGGREAFDAHNNFE